MNRRHFLESAGAAGSVLWSRAATGQQHVRPKRVHPGVWKYTFGTPEKITPAGTRKYPPALDGFMRLPDVATCPVTVSGRQSPRGWQISVPLAPNEMVYGLGLQMQSFLQRGMKKQLRVNADPRVDLGDSHAPVPFYVTTHGYGVFVDTARYATFYCGAKKRRAKVGEPRPPALSTEASTGLLPAAHRRKKAGESSEALIEVPVAQGVDVYVFAGPAMRQAVQRYNLFSGGGSLPPRWGLGLWYRVEQSYTQEEVLALADEFRARKIPCDVIGLEPGYQTHAYPCTFVWSDKFPDPAAMIKQLAGKGYRLNLWEHCYTDPDSPIYEPLLPHSGDFETLGGVVPDFLVPEAREIFADHHEKEQVSIGVSGYKLDECDNSDFTGNWAFPELASFPSGADGEQMHSLLGLRYQDALQSIFEKRKTRTYGLVRSNGAMAGPYPYVVYSDLYNHRNYIRGIANSGFCGLLWTPEVRDGKNGEDLVRRLQSVALSPVALINAWQIKNPPWKQVDRLVNNSGQIDPAWEEWEARCRAAIEMRMRFIPYLHAAFVRYHRDGLPPFRAVVMDYPNDTQTWLLDSQYLMGDSILVAPAFAGEPETSVYLPEGEWYDFWSAERHKGGRSISVKPSIDQIPIFVKSGTILPLAEPTLHTEDAASWRLTAHVYGERAAPATLFEDDGSWNPALTPVTLTWDAAAKTGNVAGGSRYRVTAWKVV